MDPILGVVIGLSMPMLFGYILGYRMGRQATSKDVKQLLLSRPTKRAPDLKRASRKSKQLSKSAVSSG